MTIQIQQCDWQKTTCAICHGKFVSNKDVQRTNGTLYHRSCAQRAGIKGKYRGVTFVSGRGNWLAYISGHKFRGPFSTAEEAALAYNEMAIAFFGDKAKLNELPDDPPPPEPNEIAAACAAIRRDWTEQEYRERAPHLAGRPARFPSVNSATLEPFEG